MLYHPLAIVGETSMTSCGWFGIALDDIGSHIPIPYGISLIPWNDPMEYSMNIWNKFQFLLKPINVHNP
jgi:hypothetical protein